MGWRQRQIASAAEKRTGVGRRRHRCSGDTDPKRQGGRRGGVVLQEEDHSALAEERPQGTVSALLELFRRLLQIAHRTYRVRELEQPRSFYSGLVQRGESNKTTRPGGSTERSTQEGEQRARGRRRRRVPEPLHRSSRSPLQGKISSIFAADAPQGRLLDAGGGFSPAVSPVK